jgi:Cof subfamily protein (haloacid dehalogenase superfamily)
MHIFVFDLDETLLNRERRIGSDTHRELMKRLHNGDHIILATSRPIRAVKTMLDPEFLQLVDTITLNGAIHHDASGHVTQHSFLGAKAQILISHLDTINDVHYYVESEGECFATNASYSDEELEKIHFTTRDKVIPLADLDFRKTSKVAVDGLGKPIDHYSPIITSLGLQVIPCLDGAFLNVIAPGCDKSTTLQKILDHQGVKREDVIVFGDDIPDIEMMRLGGISVAPSNAISKVKAIANYIIGDCDDDVIGEFIRNTFS